MRQNNRLVHIISSLKRGGAETLLAALTKELKEFEHHVFFFHDGPLREELTTRGISTYQVSGRFVRYSPIAWYHLYRKIRSLHPLCIHTSLWAAHIAGSLMGFYSRIPVIHSAHTLSEHEGKLRTFLQKYFPFKATHYIAVSDAVKDSLLRNQAIHDSSITVIKNGIDISLLPQDQSSQNKSGHFVIGSVGRFVPVKNYDLLLKSFSLLAHRYNHIHLMLVGHGPEEKNLRTHAEHLGLSDRVTFIVGKKASDYYSSFDCFVQPSSYEGLSLALLEALYCQLPAIVTGIHTAHEVIINQYNGLVIPPDNEEALTEALELFITQQPFLESLRKNTRRTIVDGFTIERTAQHYRQLFENVSAR